MSFYPDDIDDQLFVQQAITDLFPNMKCFAVNNDGFEFLKEFKKDNPRVQTHIFIYSTSSNFKDREWAKSLGAKDYITKFSDLHSLKVKLRDIMQTGEV